MSSTIYTHYKKAGRYIVITFGEMQILDTWYPAVIYKSLDTGKIYVREEISFDKSFNILE